MSTRAPGFAEVIRNSLEGRISTVHTSLPAVVTAYDENKQRCSVQPLIKNSFLDEEGTRQIESFPIVNGVPVVFPGGGGFRATFPISDGSLSIEGQTVPATTGLLIFSERSMDTWLSGHGQLVDPEIDQLHDLSDGIFLAGLNPFGAPLSSCPASHATIGADSGVQAHFHRQIIALGDESGNDFVALAQKVISDFNDLKSHFSAVEGVLTGPPINEPGNGAPSALQAALSTAIGLEPYPDPGPVAASQVKAK